MELTYLNYVNEVAQSLKKATFTDGNFQALSEEDAMNAWVDLTSEVKEAGRFVFLIGNGASATMASHFAADISKNGMIRAMSLNDQALLTAIGNDNGYENVFSMQLYRYASKGDLLVTVSSSGNSPNIIKALHAAEDIGMNIVTLSGFKPDNQSRPFGKINLYVPALSYGIVECSHNIVLHCWMDRLEKLTKIPFLEGV